MHYLNPTAKMDALLSAWQAGDLESRDRLIAMLHPELSVIAAARLRGEYQISLSTDDLINDAMVRMLGVDVGEIQNRAHFLALSSHLMRNILIDHARGKNSDKRQHYKVELTTRVEGVQHHDLIALDTALVRLSALNRELAEIVEMRYFGGMSLGDIGTVLGMSEATAKRRWFAARAWLADALLNTLDGS